MGWVVSVTLRPRFTPGAYWIGGWVDFGVGREKEANGKLLYLCRGSNPYRSINQSVFRHYTD
jgi:hypothetical protein